MTTAPTLTVTVDAVLVELRAQLGQLGVDLATERAANAARQTVIDELRAELATARESHPAAGKPAR